MRLKEFVAMLFAVLTLSIRTDQIGFSKQCIPRSDAAYAASDQGLHYLPVIQQF